MANRYFTIMVIPEKTDQVRKLVVPAWAVRGIAIALAFFVLVAIVMVMDYWFVMSQIGENKELRMENRRLRQQVQVFKNKMTTVEGTMERIKTFATRLKVITNIEDRGGLLQSLNQKLPDAASNIGNTAVSKAGPSPAPSPGASGVAVSATQAAAASKAPGVEINPNVELASSPEDVLLRKEYEHLDERFTDLNRETLYVEQVLQDQYELLADQKSFLAALPTRRPAIGYFTSGFGVRRSPYGGKYKMHEGLDIANRPGTLIRAPADGVVIFSDSKAGYGQTVILDHGYGLETWYGHTRKSLVTRGQKVRRGDQLALLGNSGRSTGPHVHYEVRVNGTPVDPLSYILEN
jgi:murein DD-endopeptidase MepM/ murein hydrolase activator NlpD